MIQELRLAETRLPWYNKREYAKEVESLTRKSTGGKVSIPRQNYYLVFAQLSVIGGHLISLLQRDGLFCGASKTDNLRDPECGSGLPTDSGSAASTAGGDWMAA